MIRGGYLRLSTRVLIATVVCGGLFISTATAGPGVKKSPAKGKAPASKPADDSPVVGPVVPLPGPAPSPGGPQILPQPPALPLAVVGDTRNSFAELNPFGAARLRSSRPIVVRAARKVTKPKSTKRQARKGGKNRQPRRAKQQVRYRMFANQTRGVVALRQSGAELSGTLVVYGLEPRSRHDAHIHGPGGSCAAPVKQHALDLPTLRADKNGVARITIRATVGQQIVGEPGYFVFVHQNAVSGKHDDDHAVTNPAIGCGNLPVK